ncbi:MAG: CvpA family protein [Paracoccaceae bacterium]
MEFDNNIVDIISLVIVAISMILSFSRGLIRECYTVIAWILSFFSAIQFGPKILPLILGVPFLEDFLLGNCPLAMLVSYIVTFVLSITAFSIVIIVLNISKSKENQTIMNSIDKFGGVLFGFMRSIIILLLLLILTQDFLPDFNFKSDINNSINKSLTSNFLEPSKNYLSDFIYKNGEKWLKNSYDFVLNNKCL